MSSGRPRRSARHKPGAVTAVVRKTCTSCGRRLPATPEYFYYRNKPKLDAACKACKRERFKRWAAKPGNAERNAARASAWNKAHPSNRSAQSAMRRVALRSLNAAERDLVRYLFALRDHLGELLGEPAEVHHLVSVARGGCSCPSNLTVVSRSQNRSIGSRYVPLTPDIELAPEARSCPLHAPRRRRKS